MNKPDHYRVVMSQNGSSFLSVERSSLGQCQRNFLMAVESGFGISNSRPKDGCSAQVFEAGSDTPSWCLRFSDRGVVLTETYAEYRARRGEAAPMSQSANPGAAMSSTDSFTGEANIAVREAAEKHSWSDKELEHALGAAARRVEVPAESVIPLSNGRAIHRPAGGSLDYVRIVQDGHELGRWADHEFTGDPLTVMSALLDAAKGPSPKMRPASTEPTIAVRFGEVPNQPGYEQWLVTRDGAFVTDFGKQDDAETFALQMRKRNSVPVPSKYAVADVGKHPESRALLDDGWLMVDEATRELFNRRPAVFMRNEHGSNGVRYDLTITLGGDTDRPWIPVHGATYMEPVATCQEAAATLLAYAEERARIDEARAASERHVDRPRG